MRVRNIISQLSSSLRIHRKNSVRKPSASSGRSQNPTEFSELRVLGPKGAPGTRGLSRRKGKLRASSGFTLLEVLVALTVFAVGAAVMLSLISGSLGNIRKVQLRTRTIEHAEAVMELALLDESIQGPTSFAGDFEDGTRWSVLVEDYVLPDIPILQPNGRQVTMPVKTLSYTIEMFSPNAMASDYRLQTLKLVRTTPDDNLVRMP